MRSVARKVVAVAITASAVLFAPRPAQALSILGFGAEAEEIVAAIIALQTAVTELQRAGNGTLDAMTHVLGDGEYDRVMDTLRTNEATLQRVYAELERIGATEVGIRSQWERTFPQDAAAWRTVRFSDFDTLYTIWNSQLVESSGTAARAQAALADVRDRNERASEILRRSLANKSEVQQLQTQNQMLAVVQRDLSSILQSVASQGRVVAQMAAESASEKALARESTRRRWEHHSDPVPPPPARLTRFPDIASH